MISAVVDVDVEELEIPLKKVLELDFVEAADSVDALEVLTVVEPGVLGVDGEDFDVDVDVEVDETLADVEVELDEALVDVEVTVVTTTTAAETCPTDWTTRSSPWSVSACSRLFAIVLASEFTSALAAASKSTPETSTIAKRVCAVSWRRRDPVCLCSRR